MAVLDKTIAQQLFVDKELSLQVKRISPADRSQATPVFALGESIELHYVRSGQLEMQTEGNTIKAGPGDMIVLNGNTTAEQLRSSAEQVVITVAAPTKLFGQLEEKSFAFRGLITADPEIERMMDMLCRELMGQKTGYQLQAKSILLQLFVWLLRQYRQGQEQIQHRADKQERIQVVRQYIHTYYMEPISVPKLAELIHVSESRLIHLFKEEMGVSPLKYINAVRLHKAKRLLEEDEYPVMEVAAVVGFSDYNHFGRMFRERFGCTPAEARKNGINSRNV